MTLAAALDTRDDLAREATAARVRDAAFGGKDHYADDRLLLAELEHLAPGFTSMLRDVRAWHIRVVRLLASRGYDQFLDCSTGLPTPGENTHQIAQGINPEANVVYADADHVIATYGRALLDVNDRIEIAHTDPFDPARLLNHERVQAGLDLDRPVVLLLTHGIQHEPDNERVTEALVTYRALLPGGSAIAFSTWADQGGPGMTATDLEQTWNRHCRQPIRCRGEEEMVTLCDGLDLVPPGLVTVTDWWPHGPTLHALPHTRPTTIGALGLTPIRAANPRPRPLATTSR